MLFYVFAAILLKAPFPQVVAVSVGIFRWPLVENELSKMGGNLLLTYLLIKRKVSVLISSGSFTIFYLKNRDQSGVKFFKMNQS